MNQEIQKTNQEVTTPTVLATSITLLRDCKNSDIDAAVFVKEQAAMTVKKSFSGQSLRSLDKSNLNTFDLLNNLLWITSKSLNVKENINEFQAFDIINTLLEDYKDVKIEEFIYIFKQGKKGIYGPHYNKFDIETIVRWINAYFTSNEYNDFLENRHKQLVEPIEHVELTKEQKDKWKIISENIKDIGKKPFTGNLEGWANSATISQLEKILTDFEKAKFTYGIDLIKSAIHRRGQNTK